MESSILRAIYADKYCRKTQLCFLLLLLVLDLSNRLFILMTVLVSFELFTDLFFFNLDDTLFDAGFEKHLQQACIYRSAALTHR